MNPSSLNEHPSAVTQQPTGTWTITQAATPKGNQYSGKMTVEAWGPIYRLRWETTLGNYPGLGFLEDGHLFAGWGDGIYSIMLYRINPDGSLSGRWVTSATQGETPKIFTEKASGGNPVTLEGSYQVKGNEQVDGAEAYEGVLDVCMLGETYQLTWYLGRATYSGVGLRVGDWLVAAQCNSVNFGVMDYAMDGETLQGQWGLMGNPVRGQESFVHQSD